MVQGIQWEEEYAGLYEFEKKSFHPSNELSNEAYLMTQMPRIPLYLAFYLPYSEVLGADSRLFGSPLS
jgi:hypothetical protein